MEVTVYTSRDARITLDELRERMAALGLPVTAMSDMEETASTGRWFLSIEPDPAEDEETMLDQQMVVMDVNHDRPLVQGAASSLLQSLEEAEADEETTSLRETLRLAQQSVYCAITGGRSSGMRVLQVVSVVACLDIGGGLLHDGANEEFFSAASASTFLRRELGNDAEPFIAALSSTPK